MQAAFYGIGEAACRAPSGRAGTTRGAGAARGAKPAAPEAYRPDRPASAGGCPGIFSHLTWTSHGQKGSCLRQGHKHELELGQRTLPGAASMRRLVAVKGRSSERRKPGCRASARSSPLAGGRGAGLTVVPRLPRMITSQGSGGGLWWRPTRQGIAGSKLINTIRPGAERSPVLSRAAPKGPIGLIDFAMPWKTHAQPFPEKIGRCQGHRVRKAVTWTPDIFLSWPVAVGSDRASIRTVGCVPSLNAVLVGVRS